MDGPHRPRSLALHSPRPGPDGHELPDPVEVTGAVKDPVCGMMVDPSTAKWRLDHGGQTYFFCNPSCLDRFRRDPAAFLAPRPPPPADATAGSSSAAGSSCSAPPPAVVWVCPMHPEVRLDHPGTCPKCGMALEPETPSASAALESNRPGEPRSGTPPRGTI